MGATTIKVPTELRDRINSEARAGGLTAAGLIAKLLDERQRAARFAALGRAFAGADESYQREVGSWDTTSSDGLDPW